MTAEGGLGDEGGPLRVGMLHTVPALASDLEDRLSREVSNVSVVHVADNELLQMAIRGEDPTPKVLAALQVLESLGSGAILVSCSSIGEAAEAAASELNIPVWRIDQGMAEEAAALLDAAAQSGARDAGHVVVLGTLNSTLGPSSRLVEKYAPGAVVEAILCEGAAAARSRGDNEEHDRIIAGYIEDAQDANVIVLAQASMANAANAVAVAPPVLTSTDLGIKLFAEEISALANQERSQ